MVKLEITARKTKRGYKIQIDGFKYSNAQWRVDYVFYVAQLRERAFYVLDELVVNEMVIDMEK